jgi:biopolymer transport protein ExbB
MSIREVRIRRWRNLAVTVTLLAIGSWAMAQGVSAPATQPAAPPAKNLTFLQLILRGGWFMVPIGLCSVAAVTLILERSVALRKKKVIPPGFLEGLARVGLSDRKAAMEYCRGSNTPVGRVIASGIRKLPQGEEAVERAIEDAGHNEVARLRKNLRTLYSLSVVSPMLGLVGTVSGMILAFQVAARGGMGKAELLAGGIYEALITTLGGLSVAIPVLVFYYYFLGKIDRIVAEMNDLSEQFLEEHVAPGQHVSRPTAPAVTPPDLSPSIISAIPSIA